MKAAPRQDLVTGIFEAPGFTHVDFYEPNNYQILKENIARVRSFFFYRGSIFSLQCC